MISILKRLSAGSLAIIMVLFSASSLLAQTIQVTGTVISAESRLPVTAASVSVKGSHTGTTTNVQGQFKISVNDANVTLIISSTGFAPVEVPLKGQTNVMVQLTPDVRSLDDVVVIGYQTIKRKDLLASVSSVSAKDLKDIPINSAEQALAGKLAGVQVIGSEGSPDAQIQIRVRGG
ncbi:MAG: carboxypeptidase-like regulatory domain-containing protein, partial [Bacteroidetes bacterium]|nr:carboxypeptidase-like regulatory domain-containing protein [Bacteroidota bacterium]